jgi:hypothetical protein
VRVFQGAENDVEGCGACARAAILDIYRTCMCNIISVREQDRVSVLALRRTTEASLARTRRATSSSVR